MKITKTKLRQIIKEELDQHLATPGEEITKAIKAIKAAVDAADATRNAVYASDWSAVGTYATAALTAEESVMDALGDYIEQRIKLGHEISVIRDDLSKHIETLGKDLTGDPGLYNLISAFIENY